MNFRKKADTNFKEKQNVIEFDLKNISVKKQRKKAYMLFKKHYFC